MNINSIIRNRYFYFSVSVMIVYIAEIALVYSYNGYHNCTSEFRCRCIQLGNHKYKADCSSLGLEEIPTFSEDVTEINIRNNSLDACYQLSNETFPRNLQYLDISACHFTYISKGVFHNLPHLKYLDISYHRELTLNALTNITYELQFTEIKTFRSDAIQCKYGPGLVLKRRYLHYLKNTSLEEIHLSDNRIAKVEQFVLSDFPESLQRITAADNRFVFSWAALEIPYMKNLNFVNISVMFSTSGSFLPVLENNHCNDLNNEEIQQETDFPFTLSDNRIEPSVISESCLSKYITTPPTGRFYIYICAPRSLRTVIITHSLIRPANVVDVLNAQFDFRHVHRFDCNSNLFKVLSAGSVFGSATSYLDYSDNYVDDIQDKFFHKANLTYLDMSENYLNNYFRNHDRSVHLLTGQKYLQNLSLARNKIDSMPDGLLNDALNLRSLDVSFNELDSLNFLGENLNQLTIINLTGNYIQTLTHRDMKMLGSASNNILVDLSLNNILCTCETLTFLKWMYLNSLGTRIKFHNLDSYKCTSQNSTKHSLSNLLTITVDLEKQCSSYLGLIVGSAIALTLIIFFIIGGAIYRCRWKIRYIYYMAKRGYKGHSHVINMNQGNCYKYDAFISYAEEDKCIVLKNFVLEIEEKADIKFRHKPLALQIIVIPHTKKLMLAIECILKLWKVLD